ncbi:MAG: helix-turn-helix domain-containing protein [Desulfobacterales bacterium]|jgi:predicted site-specific integrase-resolvase|nr:helix-turn-helix domain-containing protein [Desulfobacterales bacterium]
MDLHLLDEKQVAEELRIKVQTLRNWRHLGKGPAYLKLGSRAIRYRKEDCEAFAFQRRIDPNGQSAA